MYSGLAHVLLHRSYLKDENGARIQSPPSFKRKSTISKADSLFAAFKPTYLEIEYGLLLEAAARHWIREHKKVGTEVLAEKRKSIVPNSGATLLDFAAKEKKLKAPSKKSIIVGEAWLRDRTSLWVGSESEPSNLDEERAGIVQRAPDQTSEVQSPKKKKGYFHPNRSSCICGALLPEEGFHILLPKRILKPPTTNGLEYVL